MLLERGKGDPRTAADSRSGRSRFSPGGGAAAPRRPRGPVALPFRVFPLHYGRLLLKDIYLSERTDLLRRKRELPEVCVSDTYEPVCS